tara:strand:- start:11358 stop:13502 length:2145 start_codon:yes stop_codon:yes gene_type:complete
MTTTPQIDSKEKAHADNMGNFIGYIADIENATPEQRAQDDSISQLDDLQDGLNLPTNHIDNTRYLHDDISMRGGNSKGDKLPNTKGRYGLIMVNNKAEPVNMAARTANNDNEPPIISDTTQAGAYAIGPMSHDSDWWLVTSLSDQVMLYAALAMNDPNVTVFSCLNQSMFDMTLRHLSEVKTIHIIDTAQHKDTLMSRLSGVNAIAHITIDTIISRLHDGDLIGDLITDADTIDLSVLAWPTPEPLASDPSKPTRYPIEAWPPILRKPIEAIAYYTQVPLAMAGQAVLGAIAHIGQAHIDAPMGSEHKPTSLIIITEGESGTGKTQVMALSHFKIDQHEKQLYSNYLSDVSSWENNLLSLKGKDRAAFLDENPKPPNPVTMFDDATIEPLIDRFVDGEMYNASLSTDEAGQFFNGHTMKSDTAGSALSAITKLYSSGVAGRTRSQKNAYANPRTKAYDVRMTFLLQGQRVVLEKALTDPLMSGQGFLARAMIACPEDLRGKRVWNDPKRRNDRPHDNPYLIDYWSRCQSLLDPLPANLPNDSTGAPSRIKMQWASNEALQAFEDGMQAIENRQASGQVLEYLKAYASRMAENATRIASLMAFFDGRKTVTTDDIKRAFMLVEYSTTERLRYLDAMPTGEQNDSEKLSSWLVDKARNKNPHKLNRTYIANNVPNPMRKSTKLLQIELDKLESAKHIRQEMEGRSRVIFINPKLYD